MNVGRNFDTHNLGITVAQNSDVLARADRDLTGGNTGFYRKGVTVFASNTVYEKSYNIQGEPAPVKGAVFVTSVFDVTENGLVFLKNGLVSPSAITRMLYASDKDATGALSQVEGILTYGNTPKEIVSNLIKAKKGIAPKETKQLCRPGFDRVNRRAIFDSMVRRDYTIFHIIDLPQEVANELYGSAAPVQEAPVQEAPVQEA